MNEEVKKVFTLSEEELTNPTYRKGWPGYMTIAYPNHFVDKTKKPRVAPHDNYQPWLSSYYRAGRYVAIRGELMSILTTTGLAKKNKKNVRHV